MSLQSQPGLLIPHLFRTEFRKIVSALVRKLGLSHLQDAEDIVSETFLIAAETWGIKGIPENPPAWLHQVAKNKAKDYLRRKIHFQDSITPNLKADSQPFEIELNEAIFQDSQLQMMFAICHPNLSPDAQIGLCLRILCGLGIDEIASAFQANKETINKRLFRARESLREIKPVLDISNPTQLQNRVNSVATTLYLLFNEGYASATNSNAINHSICFEAIRLAQILHSNQQFALPQIEALLALMSFHFARFPARADQDGNLIELDNQDQSLWDKRFLNQAQHYLNLSARGNQVTKFHLEAAIAYYHIVGYYFPDRWSQILNLYNQLLQIEYNPQTEINQIYALYKTHGPTAALQPAQKLNLNQNPYFHSLLAELYHQLSQTDKAQYHHSKALNLAPPAQKRMLQNRFRAQ